MTSTPAPADGPLWGEGPTPGRPQEVRSVWPLWGRGHDLALDGAGRPACWCGPRVEVLDDRGEWVAVLGVCPGRRAVVIHKLAADEG